MFYKKAVHKNNIHRETPVLETLLLKIDSNTGVFVQLLWYFQEHQKQSPISLLLKNVLEKLRKSTCDFVFFGKFVGPHHGKQLWKIAFHCLKSVRICSFFPTGIYLLKVNNRNTRTRCEICLKLTIKTPERRQWRVVTISKWSSIIIQKTFIGTSQPTSTSSKSAVETLTQCVKPSQSYQ